MRNAGLDESQAAIKIAGRNFNNLIYADDTALMAESEEELRASWWKVKEESEKAGLKLNITKLWSWHLVLSLHGKQMGKTQKVSDFIFLGFKITVDDDWSHEIKRHLLLCRQCVKMWQCIKKRYHFADKGPYSPSYGFSSSVWMWVGPEGRLSTKELILSNCGAEKDS